MLIRRERPEDHDGIDAVHRTAFDTGDGPIAEVALVRALRGDVGWLPKLSLVAIGSGQIVGHVTATRAMIDDHPALGLGPLGVRPEHQSHGVGSALMHAVLAAAEACDEHVVCLLGDPRYYRRFDFTPAPELGIEAPDPAWGPHFQARVLRPAPPPRGRFTYAAPFSEL